MALTMKALGHLAYLALACALVLYGDWKYRRSGTRGLWRDWVILATRSEEHTSELQSRLHLVCRLLLEKKKIKHNCRPNQQRKALPRVAVPSPGGPGRFLEHAAASVGSAFLPVRQPAGHRYYRSRNVRD